MQEVGQEFLQLMAGWESTLQTFPWALPVLLPPHYHLPMLQGHLFHCRQCHSSHHQEQLQFMELLQAAVLGLRWLYHP